MNKTSIINELYKIIDDESLYLKEKCRLIGTTLVKLEQEEILHKVDFRRKNFTKILNSNLCMIEICKFFTLTENNYHFFPAYILADKDIIMQNLFPLADCNTRRINFGTKCYQDESGPFELELIDNTLVQVDIMYWDFDPRSFWWHANYRDASIIKYIIPELKDDRDINLLFHGKSPSIEVPSIDILSDPTFYYQLYEMYWFATFYHDILKFLPESLKNSLEFFVNLLAIMSKRLDNSFWSFDINILEYMNLDIWELMTTDTAIYLINLSPFYYTILNERNRNSPAVLSVLKKYMVEIENEISAGGNTVYNSANPWWDDDDRDVYEIILEKLQNLKD